MPLLCVNRGEISLSLVRVLYTSHVRRAEEIDGWGTWVGDLMVEPGNAWVLTIAPPAVWPGRYTKSSSKCVLHNCWQRKTLMMPGYFSSTDCSLQSTKPQSVLPEPGSQAFSGITQSILGQLYSATTRVSLVFFELNRQGKGSASTEPRSREQRFDNKWPCKILVGAW